MTRRLGVRQSRHLPAILRHPCTRRCRSETFGAAIRARLDAPSVLLPTRLQRNVAPSAFTRPCGTLSCAQATKRAQVAEIILVRHGQANSHATDEQSYDRLSDLGREQARWLGAHLRTTKPHFDQA